MNPRFLNSIIPAMLLLIAPLFCSPVAGAQGDVVEVVVTGRQPGPPFWKVTKGANTLWILPLVSTVPRDMVWEDDKVAAVIMEADEAISAPDISVGVSKALLLNPLNLIRGIRLYRRIRSNPDGKTLEEVLPATVYHRYQALKAVYFPGDDKIDRLRPGFAVEEIMRQVLDEEKLTSSEVITRQVEKHLRRNRGLKRTDIKLDETLEGGYGELSKRVERMMSSMSPQNEIACFDMQLTHLETHVDDMKEVANSWATGYARDIEDYLQPDFAQDACSNLLLQSSEGNTLQELLQESRARWLSAAVSALERNRSTFTMLQMVDITGNNSLLARLEALGFEVHEPK